MADNNNNNNNNNSNNNINNSNNNNNNSNNNNNNNVRKRPVEESSSTTTTTTMPAATPSPAKKPMWGLRQLSWKICKIVKERGVTTYAQVADELCSEIAPTDVNVRRRVYDALNVLTGLDIIQKNPHTRTIQWMGYPAMTGGNRKDGTATMATTTIVELRHCLDQCRYRLHEQHQQLQELLTQAFCYRNLILLHHHDHHHQQRPTATDRMGSSSSLFLLNDVDPASRPGLATTTTARKILLPCLLVRTPPDCIVRCNMSPDRTLVHFRFSTPFEISDDTTILQQLGLHQTSWNDIQKILPSDMIQYCVDHSLFKGLVVGEV